MHWLGIDFSGDYRRWCPGTSRSNVWIARVEDSSPRRRLTDLVRVQQLSLELGDHPFDRLTYLLRHGNHAAAAIDAPFSVPREHAERLGTHAELLRTIGSIPLPRDRPFPDGATFVRAVTGYEPPLSPPKPLRETESFWRHQGVNVRSTLWNGARGGAPMTAACLTLLHGAGRPIWPWTAIPVPGMIVEAFPAGQLRAWSLPHTRYDGKSPEALLTREGILEALSERLDIPRELRSIVLSCSDALDAVLCAFAAIAVTEGKAKHLPDESSDLEGWIAVHK